MRWLSSASLFMSRCMSRLGCYNDDNLCCLNARNCTRSSLLLFVQISTRSNEITFQSWSVSLEPNHKTEGTKLRKFMEKGSCDPLKIPEKYIEKNWLMSRERSWWYSSEPHEILQLIKSRKNRQFSFDIIPSPSLFMVNLDSIMLKNFKFPTWSLKMIDIKARRVMHTCVLCARRNSKLVGKQHKQSRKGDEEKMLKLLSKRSN